MGHVSRLSGSRTRVPSCLWLWGLASGGHPGPWPASLTCHCSWSQVCRLPIPQPLGLCLQFCVTVVSSACGRKDAWKRDTVCALGAHAAARTASHRTAHTLVKTVRPWLPF